MPVRARKIFSSENWTPERLIYTGPYGLIAMGFKDEVEEVCGMRPKSWTWKDWVNTDEPAAYLWFDHYTKDSAATHADSDPGDPLPLPFEVLEALNEHYGVIEVESHSDGRTSSKLSVLIEDCLV